MAVLRFELRQAVRHAADTLGAVLFLLLAGALFPLALGPSPDLLRRMAPGILWVCALLAALLPLDRLFGADGEDGTLDQLLLAGLPPAGLALAKMAAHWLSTGLPILLAAGPLGMMLGFPAAGLPVTLGGLLMGGLCLSLLGGMGAGIVLGARRGGILLPLLVLPLATPALIFGAAASDAVLSGASPTADLLLLGAFTAAALPLAPLAAAAGLRAAAG
ncbi:heme exporter protein CcmB [Rhizosaccharibacter radicis]|uniref:Heme exporter protein B n=1 Tax=Rhizosaccharibacter radicis TaxID=2782605 RepID=A0ABT1W1L6_9PROT|nr:heme exporter protein CcmB [Acetobacteraceae bacterium KSS12]